MNYCYANESIVLDWTVALAFAGIFLVSTVSYWIGKNHNRAMFRENECGWVTCGKCGHCAEIK